MTELLKTDTIIPILTIQFPNEAALEQFKDWLIGCGEQDLYMYAEIRAELIEDATYSFSQPNPDEPFLVME